MKIITFLLLAIWIVGATSCASRPKYQTKPYPNQYKKSTKKSCNCPHALMLEWKGDGKERI